MRDIGIEGVRRGETVKTTWPDTALPCPMDRVIRPFRASMPNQLWVSDFPYVSTWQGFEYVAFVIDTFANKIVGWRTSRSQQTQCVLDTLEQALYDRRPSENPISHSDRGSQYTSEPFQRLMADNGVTCSMSRSGKVWDTAAMESFLSSLKIERVKRKVYRIRDQARADVFDYIERFDNPARRHSTTGNLSPMGHEERAMKAQDTVLEIGSSSIVRSRGAPAAATPHADFAWLIRAHALRPGGMQILTFGKKRLIFIKPKFTLMFY